MTTGTVLQPCPVLLGGQPRWGVTSATPGLYTAAAMNATEIEARLRAALSPTRIEVEDDSQQHTGHAGAREGGHFTVRITTPRFTGLSRVARHRLVYDALGPLGPQRVHALAIVARTPDESTDEV
jgi:BolA family transcriptional regulator, general stress-responsive regulator